MTTKSLPSPLAANSISSSESFLLKWVHQPSSHCWVNTWVNVYRCDSMQLSVLPVPNRKGEERAAFKISCPYSQKTYRSRIELSLAASVWFKRTEVNCEIAPQGQAAWWAVPFLSDVPTVGSHCIVNPVTSSFLCLLCAQWRRKVFEVAKSHLGSQLLLRFKIIQKLCQIIKWVVETFPIPHF